MLPFRVSRKQFLKKGFNGAKKPRNLIFWKAEVIWLTDDVTSRLGIQNAKLTRAILSTDTCAKFYENWASI